MKTSPPERRVVRFSGSPPRLGPAAAAALAGTLLFGCKTSKEASQAPSAAVESKSQAVTSCSSFTVTTNSYNGSQWWGTLTFRNNGPNALTSYKVEFDVPSGKHCTAEPESVPAGATLTPVTGSNPPHTVSNHCVFTWTNTSPLASGASKTFNYSTDTQSMSSASNVTVTDTVCGGASCSMAITTNSYSGSQWWGTVTFKNLGTSPASNYVVEFDVPSGKHCTAEPESVPAGAELTPLTGSNPAHTVDNHCVFTWNKGTVLAPGASKTFNYSTDTQSMSSASNIVARDVACGSGPSKGTGANFPPGSGPPKANPPVPTPEQVGMEHGDAAMPPPATIQPGTGSKVASSAPPGPASYGHVIFQFQGTSIVPQSGERIFSELETSDLVTGQILVVGKVSGTPIHVMTLRDPRQAVGTPLPGSGHSSTPFNNGNLMVDLPQAFIADPPALASSSFQFYELPASTPYDSPVVVSNLPTLLTGATLLGEVPGSALHNFFFQVIP